MKANKVVVPGWPNSIKFRQLRALFSSTMYKYNPQREMFLYNIQPYLFYFRWLCSNCFGHSKFWRKAPHWLYSFNISIFVQCPKIVSKLCFSILIFWKFAEISNQMILSHMYYVYFNVSKEKNQIKIKKNLNISTIQNTFFEFNDYCY